MACLAYELVAGVVKKKVQDKYKKFFENNLLKRLEKNVLSIVDPSLDQYQSEFRKMHYKLPEEVFKTHLVLDKVSLSNIHLFSSQA